MPEPTTICIETAQPPARSSRNAVESRNLRANARAAGRLRQIDCFFLLSFFCFFASRKSTYQTAAGWFDRGPTSSGSRRLRCPRWSAKLDPKRPRQARRPPSSCSQERLSTALRGCAASSAADERRFDLRSGSALTLATPTLQVEPLQRLTGAGVFAEDLLFATLLDLDTIGAKARAAAWPLGAALGHVAFVSDLAAEP